MTIEVFNIASATTEGESYRTGDRGTNDVADRIREVYQNVIDQGGTIIAAHTLEITSNPGTDILYLVADIPEQK